MPRPSAAAAPGAVVVTMEGVGARWLGPWGCGSVVTPAWNRLSAESVLWDEAFGLRDSAGEQFRAWTGQRPGGGWLRGLQEQGRVTVLLTDSAEVAVAGEDVFGEVIELQPAVHAALARDWGQTHLAGFFVGAGELLGTVPPGGSLVWIHTAGLRLPWDAPWEWRLEAKGDEDPDPPRELGPPRFETVEGEESPNDRAGSVGAGQQDLIAGWQQCCAAQIRVLDEGLAVLLDALDSDVDSQSLLAIAGVNGWGLGEHGVAGPGGREAGARGCFDEFLHVPLLVRFPQRQHALARSRELVAVDLLEAIVAGWMEDGDIPGRHAVPLLPDQSRRMLWRRQADCGMLRVAGWKLVVEGSGPPRLFVKPDDRWEQNDVAARCPDVVDALSARLALLEGDGGGEVTVPEDEPPLEEWLLRGAN